MKTIQKNKDLIIFYFLLKLLMTFIMLNVLTFIFELRVNYYQDFEYYVSTPISLGPNIGFKYLIYFLGIVDVNDYTAIFLAFTLNVLIDVAWIIVFKKFLTKSQLILFTAMLALHPYLATYTFKFSSIIFAKLAILIFFQRLTEDKFNSELQNLKSVFFWILVTLIRNSNLFIFIPIIIHQFRHKPIYLLFLVSFMSFFMYYLSLGYLPGLHMSNWPWSPMYISNFFNIDEPIIVFIIFIFVRILLFFGAREKVFTEGIEPFLASDFALFELSVYILLGIFQFTGFIFGTIYFYRKYSYKSLIPYLPILLSLFSISHARYMIPYVPLCLFGIASLISDRHER